MWSPYRENQVETRAYHTPGWPLSASCLEDSRASLGYLLGSISLMWQRYVTVWNSASTTIRAAANSARIIAYGTDGSLRIMWENMTCGLSTRCQSSLDKSSPQKAAPYIRAGVTRVSKSQPFVPGSWKCAWKHCRSIKLKVAYPCHSGMCCWDHG